MSKNSRPLKIIFEDDKKFKSSIRLRTQKETLLEIIRGLFHKNFSDYKDIELTTQQYRSEKGKIRKGQFDDVINFLKKRYCIALYNKLMNEEIPVLTITTRFNTDVVNLNMGIFKT